MIYTNTDHFVMNKAVCVQCTVTYTSYIYTYFLFFVFFIFWGKIQFSFKWKKKKRNLIFFTKLICIQAHLTVCLLTHIVSLLFICFVSRFIADFSSCLFILFSFAAAKTKQNALLIQSKIFKTTTHNTNNKNKCSGRLPERCSCCTSHRSRKYVFQNSKKKKTVYVCVAVKWSMNLPFK